MNKSPKEKSSDLFIQAQIRSPGIFMIFFLKFLEVKRSIIRYDREVGCYVLMLNILKEQVSMIKILEDQDSTMETRRSS